jgi:hypothetical protein
VRNDLRRQENASDLKDVEPDVSEAAGILESMSSMSQVAETMASMSLAGVEPEGLVSSMALAGDGRVCDVCGQEGSKRCVCKGARYCSIECQRAAWAVHSVSDAHLGVVAHEGVEDVD